MKTTSETQISTPGLGSRTEQLRSGAGPQQAQRTNSLPRISFERRRANRRLLIGQLLSLLRNEAPRFFDLAEMVGQWVWIQFEHRQPPTVTSILAELGFHWNSRRQIWQHPCGRDSAGMHKDPRALYRTYFPADRSTHWKESAS